MPKLARAEIEQAIKQVEAAKSNTAFPVLVEHFGEDRVTRTETGGYDIELKSGRELQEFDEMDRPRKRLETEAARSYYATLPTVLIRASSGWTKEVPEEMVQEICESPMGKALGVKQVPRTRRRALYRVTGGRTEQVR